MRIESVEAIWLRVPIPEERQHRSSFGVASSFDTVLVKVTTDTGLAGFGEAKASVHSWSSNHALCSAIEDELGRALVGADPRRISRLWDVMYNASRAGYALAAGRVLPNLGRRGLTVSAMSGIDIACWDLLGKSLDAPVHALIGGTRHDRLPAYASGGWQPAERIGAELKGYVERGGFRAVKMRVGIADGSLDHSVARVRAAREALGPDIELYCDAHGTFSVPEAKRFCRRLADCNVGWLEEPVSADNKAGIAEVRASTDIPIAAGESEFTRFDFRDLIELRAVDVLQPDLSICGGITEALRIEALASAYQLRFVPHTWGGAPTFAAGLHVAAAASSGSLIEYSLGANPMLHELSTDRFPVDDGFVTVPDRPGLGITIDDGFVERYRVDRTRQL